MNSSIWLGYTPHGAKLSIEFEDVRRGTAILGDRARGLGSLTAYALQEAGLKTLVWEVLNILGDRVDWPTPDKYTAFLSSLYATQQGSTGERLQEVEESSGDQKVLVESMNTPPVDLTRPQIRTLVKMYGTEPHT